MRIALPDRGALETPAAALLGAAGYLDPARRGTVGDVKTFRLPERDIPVHASRGGLHLALVGSLAVDEASTSVRVVLELDLGHHELAFFADPALVRGTGHDGASRPDHDDDLTGDDLPRPGLTDDGGLLDAAVLRGARVATPFPHVVRRHLAGQAVIVDAVIALDPVEHAVDLGIADVVAAVVERGVELPPPLVRLRRLGTVSTGRLVVIEGRATVEEPDRLARDGVLTRLNAARLAATTALLQFDCPDRLLDDAVGLLDPPRPVETVPLGGSGWTTVRVLAARTAVDDLVVGLLTLGCRDVLTFDPQTYLPHLAAARSPEDFPAPRRPQGIPAHHDSVR